MPNGLGIVDLLKVLGFDDRAKSKLVRHQDAHYDMGALIREGWFDLYLSLQARPVFDGCKQIVSFLGDGRGRARFHGVYEVIGQSPASKSMVPSDCPYKARERCKYFYKLERRPEFSDLGGRVVIDWPAARAWHQQLKNKPIIEIFPRGRLLEPFTDYLDFSLSYDQLVQLIATPEAHRDWKTSLSAVSGVYLILATKTGEQYVGLACGLGGIWSRWSRYADTGHGGNVKLRAFGNGLCISSCISVFGIACPTEDDHSGGSDSTRVTLQNQAWKSCNRAESQLTRNMPFKITITEDADRQFRSLTARDQRILEAAVVARLMHQPTAVSNAIKQLRPNPLADYELRVGNLRAV